MTNQNPPRDQDPTSGLPLPIDPGTTDLGDDVHRDADNRGSSAGSDSQSADTDAGSGLPIPIDPGTTDLGDDVHRNADER